MALLDLGRWEEAEEIADRVLATEASPTNLLTSQVTKGGSWPGVDFPEHSTYWTPVSPRPTTSVRRSGSP